MGLDKRTNTVTVKHIKVKDAVGYWNAKEFKLESATKPTMFKKLAHKLLLGWSWNDKV